MAAATTAITTGATDLVKLGRKVQGPLMVGFAAECPEYGFHTKLKKFKLAASQREVTAPIQIKRSAGLGSTVVEGSYESRKYTPAPAELTFTFVHRHYGYSFSRTTELLGASQGEKAYIFDQMKFQARVIKEAMKENFAFQTYGYSTGYVCQTSTNATQSSGTYTLINAYGESDLDNTTFVAQPFQVNSWVALIRAGALVTNAIGIVTAVGTGTIDVTWNGSVDSDANDYVVFANSLENTTIAGTDYNKASIGFFDVVNTPSVHGLSSATEPLWDAALADTSGGRFGFVKLRRGQNAIKNKGGGEADKFLVAQAVEADITDMLQSAVRYNNTMALQLDGATQIKGLEFQSTRHTPNSRAWLYDSDSLKLWEPAGQMPDESGVLPDSNNSLVITDKLQDISGKSVGVDYIFGRVFENRGNFAYFSGLTEAY